MKKKALEDMLIVLEDMKAELQGNVDKRTVHHLRIEVDRAIAELETAIKHKDELTALRVLTIIAAIFAKIELIAQAIEHLTKK